MTKVKRYENAPGFTTTDSEGKEIRLSDYHGQKHVVLVFNRGFS